MLAIAQNVGIFLRALNDGSVLNEGEQEIYSSIYVYEHTGLVFNRRRDTVTILSRRGFAKNSVQIKIPMAKTPMRHNLL